MKCAILGCGYIGQALAHFWKQGKKHHITVTTTRTEKKDQLLLCSDEIRVIDNEDVNAMRRLTEDHSILIVSVAPLPSRSYEDTYLKTAQILSEYPGNLKYLVYTSSTAVYGDRKGTWVDENSPIVPENERQRILYESEQLYLQASFKSCILRLAGIYGPGRELKRRIERFVDQELPGSGETYTNMIHRDDIVHAIDYSVDEQLCGVFNLCNDQHPTRQEYYDAVAEKYQLEKVRWNSALQSPHGGNRRVSNEKIKKRGFAFVHQEWW